MLGDVSTPAEMTSTPAEMTSTPAEIVSMIAEIVKAIAEMTSPPKNTNRPPLKASPRANFSGDLRVEGLPVDAELSSLCLYLNYIYAIWMA